MSGPTPLTKTPAELDVFSQRVNRFYDEFCKSKLENGWTQEQLDTQFESITAMCQMKANREFVADRLILLPVSSIKDGATREVVTGLVGIVKHINYTY